MSMSPPPPLSRFSRTDLNEAFDGHAQRASATPTGSIAIISPLDLRRSQSTTQTQGFTRGMRRLEQRRTMEENHFLIQRARAMNLNPPVDLRMLDYVSSSDENLTCPICRCVFVDPVILSECDHCFCRECIRQTWTEYTPLGPRGDCPTCRTPGKLGPRSATSKIIVNILDDLMVRCPNHEHGCQAQVKRGEVQDHVSIYCGYAFVECVSNDCDLPVRRKDVNRECLHHGASCFGCHQSMHVVALEQHWRKDCPDREVECRLCTSAVLYRELETHCRETCPAMSVACPGSVVGCTTRSKRAQVELHAKECTLAKLAPILTAQKTRMDEQEAAQKEMGRKLELLESGFAKLQDILYVRQENPDSSSADESRIPFLSSDRRESYDTIDTSASLGTFEFPVPPHAGRPDTPSTITSMHTATMEAPTRSPPEPPGPRPTDLPEPFSSDFDLVSPLQSSEPYASPLHHLLSMHESLREEMSRISTGLQELEGRHSMQILNENLRTREEISYLGAQVAGMGRQVHWLTSAQLQRQQGRSTTPSTTSANTNTYNEIAGAGAGVEAAVTAVTNATTALRGAARMVDVGREPGTLRRGLSEEGRTKL